jgi:uracil-DNA glycosylase family 4
MSELDIVINKLKEVARSHPLYGNIVSTNGNIVISRGNLNEPAFLFIGEAPGQTENTVGKPFVGRSGKVLDNWMGEFGIKNYVIINTVPIIPLNEEGKIRKPTKSEIDFFRPYVDNLIRTISPRYIICLGRSALQYLDISLTNTHWNDNIGFIYHPAFYLRRGQNGIEDFKQLMRNIGNQRTQKTLGEF